MKEPEEILEVSVKTDEVPDTLAKTEESEAATDAPVEIVEASKVVAEKSTSTEAQASTLEESESKPKKSKKAVASEPKSDQELE
jgi:hypothetical protein